MRSLLKPQDCSVVRAEVGPVSLLPSCSVLSSLLPNFSHFDATFIILAISTYQFAVMYLISFITLTQDFYLLLFKKESNILLPSHLLELEVTTTKTNVVEL